MITSIKLQGFSLYMSSFLGGIDVEPRSQHIAGL